MTGPYLIPLVFLLVSSFTAVQSDVCLFEVQDGCLCKMDDPLISVTCMFNDTSNTTGPLITSNLTESVRLNSLNISNNNLTELSPDFFDLILSVSHLDLSHNKFSSIPLSPTMKKNITKLNLSHNQLSKLTKEDFVEMTSLKDFDISFNQISEILLDENVPLWFDSFNVSHNVLRSVPVELWKLSATTDLSYNLLDFQLGLPECRLRHLYLTENRISGILDDAFLKASALETLHIAYNKLAEINGKSFNGARSLSDINLSHNVLTTIERQTFRDLPSLVKINLDANKIMKIESGVFSGLEDSLFQLSLSGNQISDIHPEVFSRLENLRYLDLSDNPALTDVSDVKFPPHIAHLDLENCGLNDAQDCVLATYRDLRFLGLAHNNLTCSCHLSWLYNWQKSANPYLTTGEKNPNWMCLNSNGKLVDVSYDPTTCNITGHLQHCQPRKIGPIDPASIGLDVTVKASDTVIVARWTLTSDLVIHGFIVTYDGKETTKFESPLLKSSVDEYEIQDVKVSGSYAVCVHVLLNETYTVKKACQQENSSFLQMIIGILAGIVFLIPCVAALAYILYKDYKVMQSTYDYLYDVENPDDDPKNEVKGEKVDVGGHDVKGHTVNVGGHDGQGVNVGGHKVKGLEVSVVRGPIVDQLQAEKQQATASQMVKGDNSVTNLGFVPDSGTKCDSDHRNSAPLKSTEDINTKL